MNERLRVEEEKDFVERIESAAKSYTLEKFNQKQAQFGIIALMSNSQKTPQEVYVNYKSRGEVEHMKNVVEADVSYIQNEYALEGWMFVNYIALHWYYKIYQLLAKHELNAKHSPMDLIHFLIEVKKVRINDTWHVAEVTKKQMTC